MEWIEAIINGIFLGGLYALFGLGLAIVFGVLNLVNLAHGEFIVLSAMLGVFFAWLLPGVNPILLTIPVAIAMFLVGYLTQLLLINRVISNPDPMVPILLTFGLSVLLRNGMVQTLGANPRNLDGGALVTESFGIAGLQIGVFPLLVFVIAALFFIGLNWVIKNTQFGRIVRATADNNEIVQIMGVRPKRIYATIMGLAIALAAVAGVLLAIRTSFTPFSGVDRLLISFEIVIIGGLGSLNGALIGGIVLGVAQIVGLKLFPQAGPLFAHITFLILLYFLPKGISGQREAK